MVGNIEKNTQTSACKYVAPYLDFSFFYIILGYRMLVFQRRGTALILRIMVSSYSLTS